MKFYHYVMAVLLCLAWHSSATAWQSPSVASDTGNVGFVQAPSEGAYHEFSLPTTGPITANDLGNGVWWRPELDETSITLMLQNLRQWGIRNVYVDVFRSGETLFPSDIFPQRADALQRDWLSYVVEQAHQQGIGVHAWMQTLCWAEAEGETTSANSLLSRYPDWIDLSPDRPQLGGHNATHYVSPSVPAVSDALTSLVAEVCQYGIDGVNFDALHYNSHENAGYNPVTVAAFLEETGIDPVGLEPDMARDSDWMRWTIYREDKLTSLVQRLVSECHDQGEARGHRIVTSVLVQPGYEQSRGANYRYQNWPDWVRNEIIDVTTPGCFEGDLPSLERQLWEVRSIHMGSTVACVPGFMLDQADRTTGSRYPSIHAERHPSLADQKRLLRNAGFQVYNIMDYQALLHEEKAQDDSEPDKRGGGFWDFFKPRRNGLHD